MRLHPPITPPQDSASPARDAEPPPTPDMSGVSHIQHSRGLLNGGSRRIVLLVLALAPMVLLTAVVIVFRPLIEEMHTFGYLGLFAWNAIASGTLLIPLPGLAAAFAAATVWNPAFVALAGACGSALGECTAYLAGRGSHSTMKSLAAHSWYARIDGWVQRRGALTIFFFAIVPLPFFDVVGFAAGSLKYPVKRFVIACLLGKIVKFSIVAAAAAWGASIIAGFAS